MTLPRNALDSASRLAALSRLNLTDFRAEGNFDRLTRLARRLLKVPVCMFSLLDDQWQHVISAQGLADDGEKSLQVPLSHSFCRLPVTEGEPLVVNDARLHPLTRDVPAVLGRGYIAYIGVPVFTSDGVAVGAFCVMDKEPRTWLPEEVELMVELAGFIGSLEGVSAAKGAELKLRRALDQVARQQFALDQHAIVATTDLKGTITYANDKFCEISGYSREELVGQNHRILKSGVHPAEFYREMYQTITQRKVWHGELCNRAKGGQFYWVAATIVPFIDQDGYLEQFVAIRSDITALKRLTEELRFSQERLTSIFEALADGLVVHDSLGRVLNSNPAAGRILGVDQDQLAGFISLETRWRAVREDGSPFAVGTHPAVVTLRTGEPRREVIMGVYRADGVFVWLSINSQPVRDADGNVQAVVCSFTDITRRLEADKALREGEARLRIFVEHSPAAVAMFDTAMRYLVASRRWYTDYGLGDRDITGLTHYEVFPEISDFWREDHRQCLAGAIIRTDQELFVRADGSRLWLSYEIRPWYHEDGMIGGIVMFTRDITQQKQAEEERVRLEQKLMETQKLESLGVLAGGIAHDFNNILTGIVCHNSLALDDLPADSPARGSLVGVQEGAQRATDLVRQMLAYSGRGRFVVNKLELNSIVEGMTQLLGVSIGKKVRLHYKLARDLPPVEVDAAQISQVIMNFVINASEAIGDRPGDIHVGTGLVHAGKEYLGECENSDQAAEGDYVFIEVMDNGCGIKVENLKRIFDPFFSTKFTGRGLGLAAVLGIVRSHRGTLKVRSEEGKGSTFTMLIPCSTGDFDIPAPKPFDDGVWRGSGTILLVDDEETVRNTVARILVALGFEVVLAVNGREGVTEFSQDPNRFSLVLLDLTMPMLDGAQVFAEIRRMHPTVPVVLMSGYSEQEATSRFSGKGLAGFLQKPFDIPTLQRALKAALV